MAIDRVRDRSLIQGLLRAPDDLDGLKRKHEPLTIAKGNSNNALRNRPAGHG